jgi:LPS-assembly protein
MDVPVFYMPYVNFPTTKRRKSGFLAPVFGTSNESGFDTQLPYYWNIAPSQDATIAPRVMQDRGVMLDGEYRYLNSTYSGTINAEYLSGDNIRNNEDRSYLSVEHHQLLLGNRARLDLLFNNVSDSEYFKDFGNTIGASSQAFMERKLEFTYNNAGTRFYAVTRDHQTLIDDLPAAYKPYKLLPRIELGHTFKTKGGFEAAIKSDASYFYKSQSLSSIRATVAPSLAYSYQTPYLQVAPKIVVAHTEYFNDDPSDVYEDQSRTVPIISIDATLFAERNFSLWGKTLFQTLEPRAYYLYIPKVNQDNLPIFDTGAMDINTHTMYLPHRFSGGYTQFGGDRVGDANRMTLGVSSRLSHKDTGRQIMSIGIGQVFHLDRREITLPGQRYSNKALSNLFAEGEINLSSTTKIIGSLVWEPESKKAERKALSLLYQPEQNTILKAAYRFTRASNSWSQNIEQVDTSFRFPIPTFKNTSMIGQWSYTLHDKTTLEAFGGIEYDSCCWSISVIGQRYLNGTNISSQPEFITGMFIQLRLRGLMGLGKGRDPLISRHLPESRSPFD